MTVILQTGASSGAWTTADATSLDGGTVVTQALGAQTVGVSFFVNITDMGGNGEVNLGDYLTVTGAFTAASYTLTLQDEDSQGTMVTMTWTAT